MSIIPQLATSLGRRDEVPNQELAKLIIKAKDKKAVDELVENLWNKNKNIQCDCIKVLYEMGERQPDLIAQYHNDFIQLLNHKNNRMIWGALTALDYITSVNPSAIYKHLPLILEAADKGSVISKDHAINIIIQLSADKQHSDDMLSLLLDQLRVAATNQLPKYAEDALPFITDKFKKDYIKVLQSRLPEIEKESKQKRVEKVIKKLS